MKQVVSNVSGLATLIMQNTHARAFALVSVLLSSANSYAASNIGGVADNISNQGSSVVNMLLIVAAVIGYAMVIGSLLKFRTAQDTGEGYAKPAIMFVVGGALAAVGTLMSISSTSVLGTDGTSDMQGKLIGG